MPQDFFDGVPNKHQDRAYLANVRSWVRRLRHNDGTATREDQFRQERLGDLATGGSAGLLSGHMMPPAPSDDGHWPQPEEP